ncbi:MAG TPA: gluconokinase [Bryobacteraceae bacterium]|nr:gluconokinase [Bryobacteraceae bacterium]
MDSTTFSDKASGPFVLSLDVGTSSVRTLLFDGCARQIPAVEHKMEYKFSTTSDGGVEFNADQLLRLTIDCLSSTHRQLETAGIRPDAVAFSAFWHSFLGVDHDGDPTTPLVHLFDTRSAEAAEALKLRIDPEANHRRTGCVLHPSYWPAKLLWLSQAMSDAFGRTKTWLSFGEYLYLKLFGSPSTSSSMASGSGLWNQNQNRYDAEILSVLPITPEQLAREDGIDEERKFLLPELASRWPRLNGIPWYPALGDGACNNVGSGCTTPDRFALMVGTSGAMRAVVEMDQIDIPLGVWCYRVDKKRFVLGGALSNGGEVFAWMKRNLQLPASRELEQRLQSAEPGSHGLTVLPLFAGERSPKWRADARAAITGMSLHTAPVDILQAALESVALRFREIYDLMVPRIGKPQEVIASGGALLNSPAWTQMMADALGRPVRPCLEPEASGRGAALLTLERLGAIAHIDQLPADIDVPRVPREQNGSIYNGLLAGQRKLYRKLLEEN